MCKVSVAMTTYNGELYVEKQLESLMNQSRRIDQVIIVDDNSTDSTVKIIKRFINNYQLHDWLLFVNNESVGWQNNFYNSIKKTTGDIVFLCDQDDIWNLDKIETMVDEFDKNERIGMLTSDFTSFSECNDVLPQPIKLKTEDGKVVFDYKYFYIRRPGCSMAVRRQIVEIYIKLFEDGMPHDATMWQVCNMLGNLYYVNKSLINYRKHGNNVTDNRSHNKKDIISFLNRIIKLNTWYLQSDYYDCEREKIIKESLEWAKIRLSIVQKHNFFGFIKILKYLKYYDSPRKTIGDLYYFLK